MFYGNEILLSLFFFQENVSKIKLIFNLKKSYDLESNTEIFYETLSNVKQIVIFLIQKYDVLFEQKQCFTLH